MYEEIDVASGGSWKLKTLGRYNHTVKVNLPNSRYKTFRASAVSQSPYGSNASYYQAYFLSKAEAENFLEEFIDKHPEEDNFQGYAYPARTPVTLIKVPVEGYPNRQIYLKREAFPNEYSPFDEDEFNPVGHAWWEQVRHDFPDYFKEVPEEPTFKNLFDESLEEDWLLRTTGVTESVLKELCEWNGTMSENGGAFERTSDQGGTDIVDVFLDDCGVQEFNTLKEAFDYYGEEGTKEWIVDFLDFCVSKNKIRPLTPIDPEPIFKSLFEKLNLNEVYNLPGEVIKRVVIKYVKENGYIKGSWNGKYGTASPTVSEINRILRTYDDLDDEMCTPEEYADFDTGVRNLTPEGPQADWMRNCIASWNKTSGLDNQDLRNLVSFASYHESNIKFQQREQARRDREAQHQAAIESPSNVGAGQVGEQVTFVVAEAKGTSVMYGRVWNMKDTQGRTFTGRDSKEETEIKAGDTVTGKIKELTEFLGIKQTKLWKVTVKKNTELNLGFF